MSPLASTFSLSGGCHCGQLHLSFSTALDPASIVPRACDCSFCEKHGAAYVSDPAGQLSVTALSSDALRRYRQGSNTADFLLCAQCGVLIAVVFENDARLYATVNARCLAQPTGFGMTTPASPQWLGPGEKVARWSQLWIPDVSLVTSGT
ncbi:hypothetical protein HDE78_002622 [Rhodanobacter sp. K2T2]|uniref:GFA family protein n=1 Tax=Rhodanobacter sp. K2T2 TaxID=2723085 RepID=UPI0015C9C65E|nr:aldehyde-activating protein [Rhodanobacter sp. K2T2]NYE29656.1 hypothetical protein [Rhodanobacter sp. K2T2]